MKKNQRNHKHVTRSSFKRISQPTKRIKSTKPRKVNSTKIGSGNKLSKLVIAFKRMIGRGR